MFQSILVPLDGSRFGEHAMPIALSIARRAGATVQLAHVHVPILHVTGISVLDSGADEQVKQQEQAYLVETVRRWTVAESNVPLSTVFLDGLSPDALRQQVEDGKADLIVMTTHGRGPLSRFWLGSVADTLVRTCPVPSLVIRPLDYPPELAVAAPFRQLLIALDGSPLAEQALEPALALGRLMESRFILLRVVRPVVMLGDDRGWPGQPGVDEHLTRQLTEEARNYLEAIAEPLRGQGLSVQTQVALQVQPAVAILEEAKERQADLLVLATHGRSGIKRLLLGSIADKVLRGITMPVLLCRPKAKT
jgi:nucleotide-binding universal stress UspA family protein